jgi:hypothetical protein
LWEQYFQWCAVRASSCKRMPIVSTMHFKSLSADWCLHARCVHARQSRGTTSPVAHAFCTLGGSVSWLMFTCMMRPCTAITRHYNSSIKHSSLPPQRQSSKAEELATDLLQDLCLL